MDIHHPRAACRPGKPPGFIATASAISTISAQKRNIRPGKGRSKISGAIFMERIVYIHVYIYLSIYIYLSLLAKGLSIYIYIHFYSRTSLCLKSMYPYMCILYIYMYMHMHSWVYLHYCSSMNWECFYVQGFMLSRLESFYIKVADRSATFCYTEENSGIGFGSIVFFGGMGDHFTKFPHERCRKKLHTYYL